MVSVSDVDRVLALHAEVVGVIDAVGFRERWTLQGLGALALLEARLAALTGDSKWNRLANDRLGGAFELLSSSPLISISLHEGLAGTGWVARLVNRGLAPADAFDVSDVDDLVFDYLSSPDHWDGNYDLMGGATGCAVYALEHPDRSRRKEMLDAYVRLLARRAQPGRHGLFWKTPAAVLSDTERNLFPDGYVNLGLAHGMAGAVAMLSRIAMAGMGSPELARLLEGSVAECLSEQRVDPSTNRRVIGIVRGDGATSRCAWCHGEPGQAVALAAAGKALGDRPLLDQAMALFQSSVSRSDRSTLQLHDIGLCHGWAGIYVISEYLDSLVSGKPADSAPIKAQAAFEIRKTCDEALARQRLPMFNPASPSGASPDPTFLAGALGVAHALLDCAFPNSAGADLPWADCMLL